MVWRNWASTAAPTLPRTPMTRCRETARMCWHWAAATTSSPFDTSAPHDHLRVERTDGARERHDMDHRGLGRSRLGCDNRRGGTNRSCSYALDRVGLQLGNTVEEIAHAMASGNLAGHLPDPPVAVG